ncbi:MAG TPA: DUF5985 family protein, partial [Polyangiales bacterium]|nr:DUF5985 family protein [Polyangiales bacterium]
MIWGAIAALSLVSALFFPRFWRVTGDRLFGPFAAAFVVFAGNYVCLALLRPDARPVTWSTCS